MMTLALTLAACSSVGLGGVYKSPQVARIDKDGNTVYTNQPKEFEQGIIRAFPDIPFPGTHKIDLDRSVIFTSPNHTMGKISLTGRGEVDALFQFYENQMESQGWNLVNKFQSATSSMYYAKPGRFVAIIIESEPSIKGGSRVSMNIGPE